MFLYISQFTLKSIMKIGIKYISFR